MSVDDEQLAAARVLQFLLDAGDLLASSLDVERTLEAIARAAVPHLAEWAGVFLPEPDGSLGARVIVHDDPAMVARTWDVVRRFPATRAADGIATVMRTGESRMVPRITPEMLRAVAQSEEQLALMLDAGMRSVISVPLHSGGRTIGVLQLVNSPSGEATDAERRAAELLAARASVALDNARLFERERQIATAFQQAALPASLPAIAGLTLDAVYQPGSNESLVGGDWYDAILLRDGRLVVSVGDVAGSGLEAAVLMSAMRQAVRTIALVYADPVTILDATDRALKNEHPDRVVTAVVGVYDPVERELSYALAGHPPPLLRRAGGEVELLDAPDLPLGLRGRAANDPPAVRLGPGDLVVFYTDGATEMTRDVVEGERRLRTALGAVPLHAPDPAHALQRAVLGEGALDDVAILALTVVPFPAEHRAVWEFASDDGRAARSARHAFVATLAARGFDETAQYAAELIFGELVGNVTRHAAGAVEVVCDLGAEPVLHVLDRGPGFALTPHLPSDLLAERGRGLYLVWTLSEEFNVSRRRGGGAHARAVLAARPESLLATP